MIVGLSQRAGRPLTRRWLRLAGSPHTTQIAWSLSTISAMASSAGMGPKGRPRKSMSMPASTIRTPWSASVLATLTRPSASTCSSSTASTSVWGRRRVMISSEESTGSAATMPPSWVLIEYSPAYRASKWDLNTWTRFLAMTARRTRRISSSLLPENITPAITSMRPRRVPCCILEPWGERPPWGQGVWKRGGRVVARGTRVKETQLSCGFSGDTPILWWFYAAFPAPRAKRGGIPRLLRGPETITRRHREQSRADRCAGHADQDVHGRREPGDRSPVRRQRHHRRRAEEGRQGADHGVREFRSAQARRADGPQSQDGRRDSNQGLDRPGVSGGQAAEDGGQ